MKKFLIRKSEFHLWRLTKTFLKFCSKRFQQFILLDTSLAFIGGTIVSLFWLLPVFHHPEAGIDLFYSGVTSNRILRVIAPFLICLFIPLKISITALKNKLCYLLLVVFFIIPFISWYSFPEINYMIYALGPIFTSGTLLIFISLLNFRIFCYLIIGLGMGATIYLILGLGLYGLTPTNKFIRPRVTFGFSDPTQSSSAIIAASFSWYLMAFFRLKKTALALGLAFVSIITLTFLMLIMAGSRNAIITYTAIVGCGIASYYLRKFNVLKKILPTLIVSVPLMFYILALALKTYSPLYRQISILSSFRFKNYAEYLQIAFNTSFPRVLLGLNDTGSNIRHPPYAIASGFSNSDSVYLTYLGNFGLIGAILFMIFMGMIGHRLFKHNQFWAIGFWCATTFFYCLDSQGLTTSNLAIFLCLAISFRYAVAPFSLYNLIR